MDVENDVWTLCLVRGAQKQPAAASGDLRLHPRELGSRQRLVLEIDLVDVNEGDLSVGHVLLGVDRVHRARVDARATVDALVGVDVYHAVLFGLVNAINRADLDARLVLEVDAGLGDDVGHGCSDSTKRALSVWSVTGPRTPLMASPRAVGGTA